MKLFLSLLVVSVVLSVPVSGQKTKPCAAAQTQADMTICWGNQYKAADAKLNQVYRQFTAKLDDAEKTQLKTAQTAWLNTATRIANSSAINTRAGQCDR